MPSFEELETGDVVKIYCPNEQWTIYGVVASEALRGPIVSSRELNPSWGSGEGDTSCIYDTDFTHYEVHVSKQGLNG